MQLNPASLYITLMRLAMLQTQRESAPGSAPPNAALCAAWPGKSGSPANYYSKYCVPSLNPGHYWYFAGGWALLALVVGFFFFWRAETRYGRG